MLFRSWKKGAKALGLSPELSAGSELPRGEPLPWDFMVTTPKERLVREYEAAFNDYSPPAGA